MHHQKMNFPNFEINAGLAYHRFVPDLSGPKEQASNRRREFLLAVCKLASKYDADTVSGRLRIFQHYCGCSKPVKLTTDSRFLCGIGYKGILEWGFTFDWTSGVPYLPGSSIKGALLSYLEALAASQEGEITRPVEWWDDPGSVRLKCGDEWTRNEIDQVFGFQQSRDAKGNLQSSADHEHQGSVVFLDAYPIGKVELERDVITPHYTPYYLKGEPPADIYSPIPTFFLTVAKSLDFEFYYKVLSEEHINRTKIERLIREAGIVFGFGARTSSGYGRFKEYELS